MKKERVDAKINKGKIAKELLKDPLQSMSKLAEKTGLGKTTVHEHMRVLNTNKDGRIQAICDKDLVIINLWQAEINRRMEKKEELTKMKTWEISQVIKENTARYTIFKGDITDEDWGMKSGIDLDKIKDAL